MGEMFAARKLSRRSFGDKRTDKPYLMQAVYKVVCKDESSLNPSYIIQLLRKGA